MYGHAKQGATYGHTKIAGKQVLRKGLSPLATTISTDTAAPVIAGMRLRAGKTGSGKGAGRMVAQAIATARAAGVTGQILVRGDSAYGTRAVVGACRRAGAQFSLVLTKNTAVQTSDRRHPEDGAWTPVRYPGAVRDPDTGAWISDAEVAETSYTAFASTTDAVTARLIVRRVKDARYPDALFPVWRYHPFFTNSTEPVADADITHRRHAIIETVFADLIDGPLAHMPSGRFGANSRLGPVRRDRPQPAARRRHTRRFSARRRARGHPAPHRSSTFPPAWPARNANPSCTCPATGPGQTHGLRCGATQSATPTDNPPDYPAEHGPTRNQQRKSWADQQTQIRPHTGRSRSTLSQSSHDPHPWIQAKSLAITSGRPWTGHQTFA